MTSSAAAGVYLERHVANMRLGMTLELFTAIGALVGGSVAFLLDERLLSFLFAGLLGYVAFTMARPRPGTSADEGTTEPGPVEPEPAPAGKRADHARSPVRRGLPGPPPRPGHRRRDLRGRRLVAARHRRRDHQGPAHEPVDGGPAARRDRDQQHDDRDHRLGQRRDLRHPRRDRPVCRRTDRDRRVRRRDRRLAPGAPGRRPPAAPAVRRRPRSTRPSRCCCERSDELDLSEGLRRRADDRPAAHRDHLRLGRPAGRRVRADDRERDLAARCRPAARPRHAGRPARRARSGRLPVARAAGRHRRTGRPRDRGGRVLRPGRATGRWSRSRSRSSPSSSWAS